MGKAHLIFLYVSGLVIWQQPPNQMGDMEHFTVHDLRRTCRSLLAAQGTPGHVAERCLNHKLKGVEGIYDRYGYFEERKIVFIKLSEMLIGLINLSK